MRCLARATEGREVVNTQAWIDLMNSEAFYRWILSKCDSREEKEK